MTLTSTESTQLALLSKNKPIIIPVEAKSISQSIREKGQFTLQAGQTVGVAVNRMPEGNQTGFFPSGPAQLLRLPSETVFISAGLTADKGSNSVMPDHHTMRAIPTTQKGVEINKQLSEIHRQADANMNDALVAAAKQHSITVGSLMGDTQWKPVLETVMQTVNRENLTLDRQLVQLEEQLFMENQAASIMLGEQLGLFDKEGKQTGIKSSSVASLAVTIPLDESRHPHTVNDTKLLL